MTVCVPLIISEMGLVAILLHAQYVTNVISTKNNLNC